jgi:hypothetical protein
MKEKAAVGDEDTRSHRKNALAGHADPAPLAFVAVPKTPEMA